LLLLALIVVGLAVSRLSRRLPRLRAVGERIANTRALSWVRRRYARQVRWLRARLDPSSPRGFPLTFTLAIGAFAAWSFGGLTQDVLGHDEAALIDPRVTRWVAAHRTGWLTASMKTVTWLGSTALIVPVIVLMALALLIRRRKWAPVAKLVAA